ncbi:MAG: stage II sporulation protein R [Oscillospiraceae bacterium]|jgi:stage II sporulation protein R|nr:stage II sporulation protein R [Oscillospiraceae bacterium]
MINFIRKLLRNDELLVTAAFILGAVIALSAAMFRTFADDCDKIPDEVFRLHILANSDSDTDQDLKYAVRDELLADFGDIFGGADSITEAEGYARENIAYIETKATEYVRAQGFDYTVRAEVAEMYFTTRVYGDITMPAGDYRALRITIGEGDGRNWWCVMFPQLCLPAAAVQAEDNTDSTPVMFTPETSRVIENGGKIKMRFFLYEWVRKYF